MYFNYVIYKSSFPNKEIHYLCRHPQCLRWVSSQHVVHSVLKEKRPKIVATWQLLPELQAVYKKKLSERNFNLGC